MKLQNIENFNPRNCISGKMNRINRITANVFRKYLSPFGITGSQLSLLFVLSKRSDLNQKKLSEIVLLEKSSLNRNLKRLIDAGNVSKDNFPLLNLTEKGKILVNNVIPEWQKAMDEMEELLEEEGKNALNVILNKVS